MAYYDQTPTETRSRAHLMEVIHVIDGASIVRLPDGRAVMVGAPPEAIKVLLLWGWPTPQAVVLAPDPLYAHGINQASFEFLVYNHLFREPRAPGSEPFTVVCDEAQRPRIEALVREILRGPNEAQMAAWGTPPAVRRKLLSETSAVAGPISRVPCEELVRVVPMQAGVARLPGGVKIHDLPPDDCEIAVGRDRVRVPR